MIRRRLAPRDARYALAVGAGSVGAPVQITQAASGGAVPTLLQSTATNVGKTILPTATPTIGSTIGGGILTAGLTALQGGSGKQVLEATGKQVAVQAVATAALAIPVVGPVVSGIIRLVGPTLVSKLGHHGLGSGCSPDEATLPNLDKIKIPTDYQAQAYMADNPDRYAYYQKCGGVWGADLKTYVGWYYWTYYVGGDQVGKGWPKVKSPFDYPEVDPAIAAQQQAQLEQQQAAQTAAQQAAQAQQTQWDLAAAQLQLQAQAQANAQQLAMAKVQADAQQAAAAAQLRAQAQVTSAQLAAQSQAQESAAIAAGQAAQAQATVAAAATKSQVDVIKTVVAAQQSREQAAVTQANVAAELQLQGSSAKTAAIVVLVAVALGTIGTVIAQKRRRGRKGMHFAFA